jgi:hypothetical protein
LSIEPFDTKEDAGGFQSCLSENLAAQRAGDFGVCVETILHCQIESEVDLDGYVAPTSDGERGDWVFRAPPAETPAFDVVEVHGLATRSDGRRLGDAVFSHGLETCVADAVYSALGDEAPFELDTPLVIHYQPQRGDEPRVEILSSPARSLDACVLRLPWPSEHWRPELQEASIRLRVVPREILRGQLVEALSR